MKNCRIKLFGIISGSFLGLKTSSSDPEAAMASGVTYDDGDCGNDPQEEDQNFHQVMEQLGASTVIEGLVGTFL